MEGNGLAAIWLDQHGALQGTVTIEGNTIQDTSWGQGVAVFARDDTDVRLSVVDNAFLRNRGGMQLGSYGNGSLSGIIERNAFAGNSEEGIWLRQSGSARNNIAIYHNTFRSNSGGGIRLQQYDSASSNIAILDNTFQSNGSSGIWLEQGDSASNNIAILDNFFQSSGTTGYFSTQRGTSDSTLKISRNVVMDSGGAGVNFYVIDSATLDATIDQNRVTGSQSAFTGAISFRTYDNASARASLSGNSSTGNAGYGFRFRTYETSTLIVDMGGRGGTFRGAVRTHKQPDVNVGPIIAYGEERP